MSGIGERGVSSGGASGSSSSTAPGAAPSSSSSSGGAQVPFGRATGTGGGGGGASSFGRERAIETILDRDPMGCYYRASRVAEELAPQLHSSRPNLITQSALVEQAWSLREFEQRPRDVEGEFGGARPTSSANLEETAAASSSEAPLVARRLVLDSVTRERVVHHLERTLGRGGSGGSSAAVELPCRAASALKSIYDESLHRAAKPPASVEEALLALSRSQDDVATLQSAILGLLTVVEDAAGEEEVASDQVADVNLPVAHLLALLEGGDGPGWDDHDLFVPQEWLAYFAQAAAVEEERREIQRARVLARLPTPSAEAAVAGANVSGGRAGGENATADATSTDPSMEAALSTPVVSTPTSSTSPTAFGSLSSPPDELVAAAVAAQALSAAFDEVLSRSIASTLRDRARAGNNTDGDQSSDAVSDDDGEDDDEEDDDDDEDDDEDDNDDDAEDEESEEEGDENANGEAEHVDAVLAINDPGGGGTVVESSRGGVDETTISEFDEDAVLRQALQLGRLSVAETAPVVSASTPVVSQSEIVSDDDVIVVDDDGTRDRSQAELLQGADDDSTALPPIPTPPSSPTPFGSHGDKSSLDPSSSSRFGSVPLPQVLLHLLRRSNALLFESTKQSAVNCTSRSHAAIATPGGMGSRLFESSSASGVNNSDPSKRDDDGLEVQLIVASLLLILEKRNDAIASLQRALLREQQRDAPSIAPPASLYASAVVEDDDEDDPADTLALNYVEDDVELTSESLENKGMRRKAAAAAYDAAALLKSLQKRTKLAKDVTRVYSVAALYALRTLRLFLLCHRHAAFVVCSSLSNALTELLSASPHTAECLPNDSENVFLSLDLYREALWTWGESVPFLFPGSQLLSALRSLIEGSTQFRIQSVSAIRSIDALDSYPVTAVESKIYKLQVLCRRLREKDMLDFLVPRPIPLLHVADESQAALPSHMHEQATDQEPNQTISALTMLGESRHVVPSLAKQDVEHLFLALCHRYHVGVFLVDGLIEDWSGHTSSPSRAPKMLATGDTLKVAAHAGSLLQFDASKCADSMAIISDGGGNGPSVNQRASKVWGSVLATQCFNPKSGIHRFAVRLDKCERGHVFVGVSTMQASIKTYVGGDKNGWGMIGTQALWHDRRKIRGDYGATFRTGSTIVVTLDTDTGTLSFSSWIDNSCTSSSFALDPSSQAFLSPRRSGQVHGTVEDWGVAFEGLPMDSKLYPAVGLYQRDDKVTLLSVENCSGSAAGDIESGFFFPRYAETADAIFVRRFNDAATWDGVEYATEVLSRSMQAVQQGDPFYFSTVLPSLGASLSLLPRSIPILSSRFAYILLPHLRRCLANIKQWRGERDVSDRLFCFGPKPGKWAIRASGSPANATECEEYIVDINSIARSDGDVFGFEGKGIGTTGRSKNGRVTITGSFSGSLLTFIEDWSDGPDGGTDGASCCVATARLSLDGKRFEGNYENVKFGNSGSIAGIWVADSTKGTLKDAPASPDSAIVMDSTIASCEAILALAISNLATIIGEDCAGDHEGVDLKDHRANALRLCLDGPLLSRCSLPSSGPLDACDESAFLSRLYAAPKPVIELAGIPINAILVAEEAFLPKPAAKLRLLDWVDENDKFFQEKSGGSGSFSRLCVDEFGSARRHVVAVMLTFSVIGTSAPEAEHLEVWGAARRVTEDVIRAAVSIPSGRTQRESCKDACSLVNLTSDFLLSLDRVESTGGVHLSQVANELRGLFRVVANSDDIDRLRGEMTNASHRALLRLAAINCVGSLLREDSLPCSIAIECLTSDLPTLLGRGHVDYQAVQRSGKYPDLDGNYVHGLSGASACTRTTLFKKVLELLRSLGVLLAQASCHALPHQSTVCNDSLILSLLALWSGSVGDCGYWLCARESDVLGSLPCIASHYRPIACAEEEFIEESGSVVARLVRSLCQRDRARSILLGTAGVMHLFTYQVAKEAETDSGTKDVLVACLAALRNEMEGSLPHLAPSVQSTDTVADALRSWSSVWSVKKDTSTQREHMVASVAGLHFLRDHGALVSSASFSGRRFKGATLYTPHHAKTFESDFMGTYFSHLIHIMCCAVRFDTSLQVMASDIQWIESLFRAIGMKVSTSDTGGIEGLCVESEIDIKARFRSRILRPLLSVLRASKPSRVVCDGLFVLAGYSSNATTQSLDEDEWLVSREAVTVLRNLHSLETPLWRECVNLSLSDPSATSTEPNDLWRMTGVLCFFSGDVCGLKRGSYVLLKPPAAVAMSQQQQSAPSSKSHLSGAGGSSPPATGAVPHHIVGNGTESVVAGLCRKDASAGIVSNFDLKNSSCEVILIGRDSDDTDETQGGVFRAIPLKRDSGRRSLTVRALRTPLSDVVMAQEAPLVFDGSVPVVEVVSGLAGALDRLQRQSSEEVHRLSDESLLSAEASTARYSLLDLQVIRTCIVILSEEDVLSRVLGSARGSLPLLKILRLAVPEGEERKSRRSSSMSSLPGHEASHGFLLTVLRESLRRIMTLQHAPDAVLRSEIECCLGDYDLPAEACETPVEPAEARRISAGVGEEATRSRREGIGRESESQVSNRSISQSTGGSNSDDDDESEAAAATAAAHLREAAIAQMSELGLPRAWSELALRRTGGTNIEAAVTFCLERSGDMERLLSEERERDRMLQRGSSASASRRRSSRDSTTNHLLRQLQDMGFPARWCAEALAVTGNNVDEALTWILTNGERLSEEDEGLEAEQGHEGEGGEADDESVDDDDDDDEDGQCDVEQLKSSGTQETQADMDFNAWSGSVLPLRFISGRANIDSKTLQVSGLPTGGFTSVGTKGVLLTSGKWYYEAVLETAGCLQIGWADASFAQHCNSDRGDGCGDGPSSWSFDGWRRYRWHCTATEWGCRWKEGDVIGCLVDMDRKIVSFHLNGKGDEIGMGIAFSGSGFRPVGGVYACVSFNRKEKLRLILGGQASGPFKYLPPSGYRGVGESVLSSVEELNVLLQKESLLNNSTVASPSVALHRRKFLCDFSDGEHGHELMAWAHRYYGSDASVHLGSTHPKLNTQSSKQSNSKLCEPSPSVYCSQLAEKAWRKMFGDGDASRINKSCDEVRNSLVSGYVDVATTACFEIRKVTARVSQLLAKKLALHVILTVGCNFNPLQFVDDSDEYLIELLWNLIEDSTSLRSVGWVGEAGAMAVAAEALGLGITSTEQLQLGTQSSSASLSPTNLSFYDDVQLPRAGISQLLSSVLNTTDDASDSIAASAEAAIGCDSGGALLSYLRLSLQSALFHSRHLRMILLATIRRDVRLLAVVEYEDDQENDGVTLDEEVPSEMAAEQPETSPLSQSGTSDKSDLYRSPDARLVTFFSGLLLCKRLRQLEEFEAIQCDLAECWSVGLLSASLPWRMICAFTLAGILNDNPQTLQSVLYLNPTLARFFGRLPGSVCRRMWAERAANPVCSRYSQSLIELLAAVKRAVKLCTNLPETFLSVWGHVEVDSATPVPFNSSIDSSTDSAAPCWEADEGFVSNDSAWEVWIGAVELLPVDWKAPNRSGVRALVDAGQGPPRLAEGCMVLRGVDWNERCLNEDGHDRYEAEKAKYDKEKQAQDEQEPVHDPAADEPTDGQANESIDPAADADNPEGAPNDSEGSAPVKILEGEGERKRKRKPQAPRLALGTVVSIEPWKGVAGMARRVRWTLTGETGLYRFGGDGGKFDICHVETNAKGTRVKKRHPLPESAEQCAARHGFGGKRRFGVLLRVNCNHGRIEDGICTRDGILEWPDFGSAARVSISTFRNGGVLIKEEMLLFGSKDSGWEVRFGQPCYEPGTEILLNPTNHTCKEKQAVLDSTSSTLSQYDELHGTANFEVKNLRDRASGSKVTVRSEMRLYCSRRPVSSAGAIAQHPATVGCSPLPLSFDENFHAASISLSHDGRTASCVSSDGRCTAFASLGFTKGVHYWEIKLEQADIGSVFVGVAEKPSASSTSGSSGSDSPPRLNRWHGWGFVNFRATYASGAERVYGAHCHSGDTIGVLLDCDAGRVSFFFDGLKYGEHIMNDLGCAFESLSPFGFNVDGCGSGGTGQGAPSGFDGARGGRQLVQGNVRPRTLWPVIGLRNQGDTVTLSAKWSTSYGIESSAVLRNVFKVDDYLNCFSAAPDGSLPPDLLNEAFSEYRSWYDSRCTRTVTRCSGQYPYTTSGMSSILDSTPLACATASAALGLSHALLAGDRVRLTRSAGRTLELAEEAIVLGSYQGRLYYRIVSQKSEGGSLTEGGGRAWFWDESEVVDGLPFVKPGLGFDVPLPKLDRFRCLSKGGLRVVYEGGAVLRSDLEIDGSMNLGTAPMNYVFPQRDVLERRVTSTGLVRYRVRRDDIEGWISARLRGGNEDMIVEPIEDTLEVDESIESFPTPLDCALKWQEAWEKTAKNESAAKVDLSAFNIASRERFDSLVLEGVISGFSALDSDALLTRALNVISNFTTTGDVIDCPFRTVCSALSCAVARSSGNESVQVPETSPTMNQAVCTTFASCSGPLPSLHSMMARIAVLKAFNRRLRHALPWLPLRPCQEGSAILGGNLGLGTSVERAGRSRVSQLSDEWVQVPSIATRLRSLRALVFTSVKREFLLSITESTTTPTPLSHDEYELPREIRTVRINRLKAARAMESDDASAKRKFCVFAQLQSEIRSWGGAALRRGYVAKGHGGQKRAFKVKLVGEGVNDYSGPYREVFTDAVSELSRSDPEGRGDLGVLDRTPNSASGIGENRDLFMFSLNGRDATQLQEKWSRSKVSEWESLLRQNFASVVTVRDESSREVEEALVFLGRITGTAFRHGIPLDLPLAMNSVWKALAEESTSEDEKLKELDYLAHRLGSGDSPMSVQPLLQWQQRMLNSFVEGLGNVLPVEVFPLFTGEELRDTLCGNPEVDVELLQRVVEYEGYDPGDAVVEHFWQTLREISNDERKQFLQFVWARNRLPIRESDFDAPFKIQKDAVNTGDRADMALPSASTCFFSLTLPAYSSQPILKAKLLFAINNVTTMETDFQTNSAEISEGYRALS